METPKLYVKVCSKCGRQVTPHVDHNLGTRSTVDCSHGEPRGTESVAWKKVEVAPKEIGALLTALGEQLVEETEPARPIHLEEELSAFGVSKDQEGVAWLTCQGLPVLNLDATFRRIVSEDGRIELPGGAVVQLCDGCEKNKAGCVSVGEEVLCAECLLLRASDVESVLKLLAITHFDHERLITDENFDATDLFEQGLLQHREIGQTGEKEAALTPAGERAIREALGMEERK